jgi:formimidoylglutamate deiminase
VQINLLEDARSLEYHLRMKQLQRVVPAEEPSREALPQGLAAFATQAGAESLRATRGSLEVGRPADFFSVDLSGPSIADAGQESLASRNFSLERTAICDVRVGGELVVRDGSHPHADEMVRRFSELQRTLWGSPERNLE